MADLGELKCAMRPKSALNFEEIAPDVFAHKGEIAIAAPENKGDLSNIGFVIGEQSVAVMDSGGAYEIGAQVYLAIREKTELPIADLVLTHMHPDHVYGASFFEKLGAKIWVHPNLPEALGARAESYQGNYEMLLGDAVSLDALPREFASVGENGELLDIGGHVLKIQSWPLAHTNNDLSVYDEASQTLFAGDLLFHQHVPVIDGSLRGWQSVADAMQESYEIEHLVAGHGDVNLTSFAAFEAQGRYFDVLAHDAKHLYH